MRSREEIDAIVESRLAQYPDDVGRCIFILLTVIQDCLYDLREQNERLLRVLEVRQ